MKKTHAVSVNYDSETGATYGPFTKAHAQYLAELIDSAAGYRDSVTVTRHNAHTVYTTSVPRRVARDIHPALWLDEDTLTLARMVASAEGITIEQALRDQAELFA